MKLIGAQRQRQNTDTPTWFASRAMEVEDKVWYSCSYSFSASVWKLGSNWLNAAGLRGKGLNVIVSLKCYVLVNLSVNLSAQVVSIWNGLKCHRLVYLTQRLLQRPWLVYLTQWMTRHVVFLGGPSGPHGPLVLPRYSWYTAHGCAEHRYGRLTKLATG